jgi:hypothetical protein
MKSVASVFALGSVLLLASSAFAADTSSQPLTRADCNKAGMSWNEGANVCASKAEGLKAESGAKAQTAKASAASNAKGASKPKTVSKATKPSKKVHAYSKKKKHAYSKRKPSYPKRTHYKHPQQSHPVERRPFRWLFRKPNRPAGAS